MDISKLIEAWEKHSILMRLKQDKEKLLSHENNAGRIIFSDGEGNRIHTIYVDKIGGNKVFADEVNRISNHIDELQKYLDEL